MRRSRLKAAIGAAVIALTVGVAGGAGVIAQTEDSRDDAAREPARGRSDRDIERRVNRLLSRMTLQEKLHQITLLPDFKVNEDEVRSGLGAVLSETGPARIRELQTIAVEETRLGIPLLFAFDTIHGFRTIFPIPLGTGASFDPQVAFEDAKYGARESAAVGLKQTYAPMVDVSHEPRWGRIAEAAGEDPFLNSALGVARVKGTQGSDYSDQDRLVASPKHLVAYGQPEGGRDYNTTDMSEHRLRNLFLPPFKAAIAAGADTAMCSFNAINGVPGCGNHYTMTEILKREWGFDGFVESDWTAVAELRSCPPVKPSDVPECGHGVAADGPAAAALALNSGVDSEMTSTFFRDFGAQLLSQGRISMSRINDAVRRILRVKFRAGLFEDPYAPYEPAEAEAQMLKPDAVAAARTAAGRSMVLLKNEGSVLPLDPNKSTAVIGPLAKNGHDMLGPWWGRGRDEDVVTVFDGIDAQNTAPTTYAEGCKLSNTEPPHADPEGCATPDIAGAVAAAEGAQQVVLAVGESREMSGEAASRSTLDLPGRQEELIRAVKATGKPVAVVLFNGRPLALEDIVGDMPALLEAWFPGVQAGHAVADVVFGKVNPGGKLPVSFPRRLGQVPIYYNHERTGRPCNPDAKYNSRYRDIPSCAPLFEFGYGLSYTSFQVSGLTLSSSSVSRRGSLTASVNVTNTGARKGDEVVQLYLNDPVASISQPVRRLRGFERVTLEPGQSRRVSFRLDSSDFGFYDNRGRFVVEPGRIDVYAGNSSSAEMKQSFTVR
ncbi:MAG TPA: beta-glucosidase BglX [Thermoleophilaceae bacterium]|nr:beta-glucosidase BglX [Thermoleophilaceae bacterium]